MWQISIKNNLWRSYQSESVWRYFCVWSDCVGDKTQLGSLKFRNINSKGKKPYRQNDQMMNSIIYVSALCWFKLHGTPVILNVKVISSTAKCSYWSAQWFDLKRNICKIKLGTYRTGYLLTSNRHYVTLYYIHNINIYIYISLCIYRLNSSINYSKQ